MWGGRGRRSVPTAASSSCCSCSSRGCLTPVSGWGRRSGRPGLRGRSTVAGHRCLCRRCASPFALPLPLGASGRGCAFPCGSLFRRRCRPRCSRPLLFLAAVGAGGGGGGIGGGLSLVLARCRRGLELGLLRGSPGALPGLDGGFEDIAIVSGRSVVVVITVLRAPTCS